MRLDSGARARPARRRRSGRAAVGWIRVCSLGDPRRGGRAPRPQRVRVERRANRCGHVRERTRCHGRAHSRCGQGGRWRSGAAVEPADAYAAAATRPGSRAGAPRRACARASGMSPRAAKAAKKASKKKTCPAPRAKPRLQPTNWRGLCPALQVYLRAPSAPALARFRDELAHAKRSVGRKRLAALVSGAPLGRPQHLSPVGWT